MNYACCSETGDGRMPVLTIRTDLTILRGSVLHGLRLLFSVWTLSRFDPDAREHAGPWT